MVTLWKKLLPLFLVSFLLSGGGLFGKDSTIWVIPRVQSPPPMEGKYLPGSWKGALLLELRTPDGKTLPKEPGKILLARDEETLYIAAFLEGDSIPHLLKGQEKDLLKPVYLVKRIEMFFGEKAYFQFIMDWMGRIYKNNARPLYTKINHRKNAYIVRAAIPLAILPRSGASQDVIKANFYRESTSGISSWGPNTGNFNDVSKFIPIFLDPPEVLVRKLVQENQKKVDSLLAVKSLTKEDTAFFHKLIGEKEKQALMKKGNPKEFLNALSDFKSLTLAISLRQEKNLREKFGLAPASLRLSEEAAKTIPPLWKPAKLLGKDFWYAFTMQGNYSMIPMEEAGMMKLPLYEEGMFFMRFFGGSSKLIDPRKDIWQYLHKYPHHPLLFGCVGNKLRKNDIPDARNLFDKKFMEEFTRLYGHRVAGFGTPDAYANGLDNFLKLLKTWKIKHPKNRREAYLVMKTLHRKVVDSPPLYPSFRNIALNSRYARKYASYHTASPRYNHMMYSLGDRISGNINGECASSAPPKYAFARGAARQYGRVWENYQIYNGWEYHTKLRMQCSPTSSLTRDRVNGQLTPDCRVRAYSFLNSLKLGTGLDRQKAFILHPYLCGVGIWRSEADLNELVCNYDTETIGKDDPLVINLRDQKFHISPMAKINIHFYDNIVKKRDRGVTVTPVALVFDRHHGYFPIYLGGQIWGFFPPTEMEKTMWAMDNHIFKRLPHNPTYTTSAFGDIFDVITNDSSLAFLKSYPILYLTGDVTLDRNFAAELVTYVKEGGTLIINGELLQKYGILSPAFTGCTLTPQIAQSNAVYSLLSGKVIPEKTAFPYRVVKASGKAKILAVTTDAKENPAILLNPVGKGKVIVTTPCHMKVPGSSAEMLALFDHLMEKLRKDSLPIEVKTPMQYSVSRNKNGWIVYCQNNSGLPSNCWRTMDNYYSDRSKVEKAVITLPASMGKVKKVIDWWSSRELSFRRKGWFGNGETILEVNVPGGDSCALEFIME